MRGYFMQKIKVGCIPVRQAIDIEAKSFKVKKFIKEKINWIIKHQKKCEEIYKKLSNTLEDHKNEN